MSVRVWRSGAPKRLLLFSDNTTLGWRVLRTITREEGERRVGRGVMRQVLDPMTRNLIGYQILGESERRGDQDLTSFATTASISLREMQINAGEHGRSRTAGLREPERALRDEPEDEVERIQRKVMVFPHVGAAQGDILRVWPK